MTDADILTAVADAVANGRPVDWASADCSVADPATRDVLLGLQTISAIVALHRAVPERSAADAPACAPVTPNAPPASRPEDSGTWGTLTLVELLGRGSFADTWRARDTRLERDVALKLLRRRERYDEAAAAAVIDEGRLLARVRHPNVVTVHGADCIDGQVGVSMELIDGRTLEQILRDAGPFGPQEAMAIGLDLCAALSAVHAAGVVHRDIKAQNVMRESGGRIVLMDFGAGRDSLADGGATGSGLAGTPLYLAPEVLSGGRATPQSDIYSLGVLLYHLVTGSYPVTGRHLRELEDAHRSSQRRLLQDARPGLPGAFVAAVERAMATDPAARFQTAGSFRQALAAAAPHASEEVAPATTGIVHSRWRVTRRPAAWAAASVAAIAVVATAAWWSWFRPASSSLPLEARDWILVTAFDNRTGDETLDGALEAVFERELGNSSFVNVVPRARVEDVLELMKKPANTPIDVETGRQVCLRDGGIAALVAGRAERFGGSYVLSAAVLRPDTGQSVARVSAEASSREAIPPALRKLSDGLRRTLGEARDEVARSSEELEKVTTPSIKAWRLYQRSFEMGSQGAFAGAREVVRLAVAEDPEFAAAHIWLAWCLVNTRYRPVEFLPVAERAVQLSDKTTEWERLWIQASYKTIAGQSGDHFLYEALLRIRPDHFWALNNLALIYERQGRFGDAARVAERLPAIRPLWAIGVRRAVHALMNAGKRDKAHALVDRLLANRSAPPQQLLFAGTELINAKDADSQDIAKASVCFDRVRRSNFVRALDEPIEQAWQFPVFERWWNGDLTSALREADALAQRPDLGRNWGLRALGQSLTQFYLAIGRPSQAGQVALTIENPDDRNLYLAQAALCSGDLGQLRDRMRHVRVVPFAQLRGGEKRQENTIEWPLSGWLLVRAGLLQPAEALAASYEKGTTELIERLRRELKVEISPGYGSSPSFYAELADARILRGDIALARNEPAAAAVLLDKATRSRPDVRTPYGATPLHFAAVELLADALARTGQTQRAVEILKAASDEKPQPRDEIVHPLGFFRLRCQAKLGELYRRLGREAEARQVDADMEKALAVAEPDFPLLVALKRRQAVGNNK